MVEQSLRDRFESLFCSLVDACLGTYGTRLVSLAIFGSAGRGTPRPDSDIDLLIVAEDLPQVRQKRMAEFQNVETATERLLSEVEPRY
jgi:predicted nucleotidyltransferase